jgi:superoxide reductase
MDRRSFIQGIGTAGVIVPTFALATSTDKLCYPDLAGGLFYTESAPGRWQEKAATHLPQLEKSTTDKGSVKIRAVTAHEMKDYEHYIVKHILLDKDFKFLDEHFFNPTAEKQAISEFEVNNYSGTLYVLSVCNKHDTWLNQIAI